MTYEEAVAQTVKENEAFAMQCDMETLSLKDSDGYTVAHAAAYQHEAFVRKHNK